MEALRTSVIMLFFAEADPIAAVVDTVVKNN